MTSEFLTDLFGDQTGIVYAPVKGEQWQQHFFEWPQEGDKLERHINDYDQRDVYISPVLFNDKRIAPETFKGTNYLWTEFDGVIPQDTITPSMRVMSSQEGHEHWYWKLDHFETSKAIIEDLTRRIAYHYGADLSVWDYQNVLRPVDTWNHKRNKPVTLLTKDTVRYSIDDFTSIPIPPAGSRVDIKLGTLPGKEAILAKYKFSPDAQELLSKVIEKGKRDQALVRFGHECAESGLSNEEIYVLLEDRDSVWGKFVGRSDREKQLQSIIAAVRRRKATTIEITHGTPEVYRFHDFMRTNINLKWAIEGLLPVAGSMVIFGKPGVGKSTFSLRLAIDLALGRDRFLLWNIINKQRVMFVSLEMQHYELKEFFKDMELSDELQTELQEQLFIWPIGAAYPFDTPDQQSEVLKYIKLHKIELIIIDSLSLSMYGSVTNDDDVKRLNSFLNEDVRRDNGCGYIFIHHPRKEGIEKLKVLSLDDGFGSQYIGANAQSVIALSSKPGSTRIRVEILKVRMKLGMQNFEVERTPHRGFQLVGSITHPIITNKPSTIEGDIVTNEKPANDALGVLFNL